MTFDVFDTLLRRIVMPPERVKVPAAKAFSMILLSRDRKMSVPDALREREMVEDELRERSMVSGGDGTLHVANVFRCWLERYFDAAEVKPLIGKLISAEFKAEEEACYPEVGMSEALNEALEKGKRVAWISDMHLDRNQISDLLEKSGYGGLFHEGFVSSDTKRSKRSGRLFKHVLDKESIHADRWVHFGDNLFCDFWMPRKLGGRSFIYLPKAFRKKRSRIRRIRQLAKIDRQWSGAEIAESLHSTIESDKADDILYRIGFQLLGPALTNFVHRVLERIEEEDINLVLFPARDGFILRRIFLLLQSNMSPNRQVVVSKYCFLTRKAVYGASVDSIGHREIEAGFFRSRKPTLLNFFSRLTTNPEVFKKVARQVGFSSMNDEIADPYSDSLFLSLVNHPEVGRLLRENQLTSKSILFDYLEQLGFWRSEKVALVDVGWRATVQDALTHTFGHRKDWPRLYGVYYGLVTHSPPAETPRSSYEGLAYHFMGSGLRYSACERFLSLLEFACRAPHPTTIGLQRDAESGGIVPMFKDQDDASRNREVQDREKQSVLQAGIMNYARNYSKILPYLEYAAEVYTPLTLNQLDRFLYLPKKSEGNSLSGIYNAEDFGAGDSRETFAESMSFSKFGEINAKRLRLLRSKAIWHEGSLATLGVPGIVPLFNLYRLFKTRFF